MATYRELIARRIFLKEQLITLERREIGALQKELETLNPEPAPQPGSDNKEKAQEAAAV